LSSAAGIRQGIYQNAFVRRVTSWLDATPHPLLACEISSEAVSVARWSRPGGGLEGVAVEPLPVGAVSATAVETNLVNPRIVRDAVTRAFERLNAKPQEVALLVPDAVIRVFVLHFDVFPRSTAEALPILRWRLKKSVPFEAEETLISFMRQAPLEDGVDIVTGLARLRIVREYESLMESAGMAPGVVMTSTLAVLPLLDDRRPVLLARIAGTSLATAIVRSGVLCGYRCIELPATLPRLSPRALLDEIVPLAAYYQDSWHENVGLVRLSGFGARQEEFATALEQELACPVGSLLSAASSEGRLSDDSRPLVDRELDALVGWSLNRGM
jgi:type IV pilus assembly protein PilM